MRELSIARLRSARRLLHRRGREAAGEFLAEGPQAVREALASDCAKEIYVTAEVAPDYAEYGDLCALATQEQLGQLTDTVNSQSVVARCRMPQTKLEELASEPQLVVICDELNDPGNAGTIIRAADAFGADAVILTKGSVDPFNPKVVRSTVGSCFHIPIVWQVGRDEAIAWAKTSGCQVLATSAAGEPLTAGDPSLARPTAWLFGNEARGLSDEALAATDRAVAIPMPGRAESLNLATAAAICLFVSSGETTSG